MQGKDFNKIEVKNNICINVLAYENGLVFPIYVSDQKFEDSMDLCFTKQKIKTKNGFVRLYSVYSVLVVKVC